MTTTVWLLYYRLCAFTMVRGVFSSRDLAKAAADEFAKESGALSINWEDGEAGSEGDGWFVDAYTLDQPESPDG